MRHCMHLVVRKSDHKTPRVSCPRQCVQGEKKDGEINWRQQRLGRDGAKRGEVRFERIHLKVFDANAGTRRCYVGQTILAVLFFEG